ncbi:MAG: HAMP domain-containing sensor histidine kinase, partial [Polyangiaceae bacterium]
LARERTNSAHIAHELRTPLTEIIGQLEALRSHDDASRLAISEIKTELLRFADVIEAILVLSEPTSKTPSSTIINVADIVRDVAPTTANVDAPDEALALGDERLIRLAVQNLVQNAQRYADGARDLRVSNDDDRVRVTVSDRGPGLDLSARERMFERYWRGAADIEGRGIGLALVRAVAERHDGSARADQRDDGPGLAVSFTVGKIIEWRTSQES